MLLLRATKALAARSSSSAVNAPCRWAKRSFHQSRRLLAPVMQFKLTDIGEGIAEAEVLQWHVKEGDRVEQYQPICEVQSDKATVEIPSKFDGVIVKLHHEVNDMAPVGLPLVDIDVDEDDSAAATTAAATTIPVVDEVGVGENRNVTTGRTSVLATPAVRRLSREHNVDLSRVPATGKQGRVLKSDILNYIKGDAPKVVHGDSITASQSEYGDSITASQSESAPATFVPPTIAVTSSDRTVPVRGMTRMMIKTMDAALQVPHFGYNDEVLMNKLIEARGQMKQTAKERGVRLTMMPFFIKAASMCLHDYPVINSQLSGDREFIVFKGAHNIGFAMDTPQGLMVPNIKNVETKSILEIAAELQRITSEGAEGRLNAADMKDGTFTLSNIGSIGGTYASPVVSVPQVAIGALGKTQKLPRFDSDDNVFAAHVMKVSWSADHRVIDGATMARFSNQWKNYLENPSSMLLGLR